MYEDEETIECYVYRAKYPKSRDKDWVFEIETWTDGILEENPEIHSQLSSVADSLIDYLKTYGPGFCTINYGIGENASNATYEVKGFLAVRLLAKQKRELTDLLKEDPVVNSMFENEQISLNTNAGCSTKQNMDQRKWRIRRELK